MNHKDVLLDMLYNYAFNLHRTIADLPNEALQWQPDPEANNIMVTLWHVCRALDILKVKIIENKPHQDQLWYAKGWASMTQQLAKVTDEERQKIRDEVLGTTKEDFKEFADVLEAFRIQGIIKILGSEKAIEEINGKQPGWLNVTNVL